MTYEGVRPFSMIDTISLLTKKKDSFFNYLSMNKKYLLLKNKIKMMNISSCLQANTDVDIVYNKQFFLSIIYFLQTNLF
jgi:hypothetical protein